MFQITTSAKTLGNMMLASSRITKQMRSNLAITSRMLCSPTTSTGTPKEDQISITDESSKVSGFAKAFEKQSQILGTQDKEENYTFASLLRNSKLMDVS